MKILQKILNYLLPRGPWTNVTRSGPSGRISTFDPPSIRNGQYFPAYFELAQDDTSESDWDVLCENWVELWILEQNVAIKSQKVAGVRIFCSLTTSFLHWAVPGLYLKYGKKRRQMHINISSWCAHSRHKYRDDIIWPKLRIVCHLSKCDNFKNTFCSNFCLAMKIGRCSFMILRWEFHTNFKNHGLLLNF